jgi:16S rRNA (cytosine1402-N4)-methyltransferase
VSAGAAQDHVPVLLMETIEGLALAPDRNYIDATVGAGGHAASILAGTGPRGQLLGIDLDPRALEVARRTLAPFAGRFQLIHGSFADLQRHAATVSWDRVDGVLMDLGFSSMQVGDPARGFSFQSSGPLDMRYDSEGPVTAADLVNGLGERELGDLLYRYGEERRSRRVARAIVAARPIATTTDLAEGVSRAVGGRWRIHSATRAFLALRIAVNGELKALTHGIDQAIDVLSPGGRLAVISFQSQEDRIVKRSFLDASRSCVCPPGVPECRCNHEPRIRLVTRRPVTPSAAEVAANPRSRSAKLRLGERLPPTATKAAA